MFPMLYNEIKDLVPEVYFGGAEVPPYENPQLHQASARPYSYMEDIIHTIRALGINSSGYIDDDGIHYHTPYDDIIHVDLSKNFVFVSQPNVSGEENPSAWQIFSFLQAPVQLALFITAGNAKFVEKTEETLTLCKTLDQLWAQERFLQTRVDMFNFEEGMELGLPSLLMTYEGETYGKSSEMWMFWNTFGDLLMKNRLGLSVHTVQ